MAQVKYVSASRVYAKDAPPAVDALDLDIKDGEFMVLVGPSGSREDHRAAHARRSRAARRRAGSRSATGTSRYVPPKDRDIAMVFQNYALYPQHDGRARTWASR